MQHLAAEPEALPPPPTSFLHQQHTWHVPEATPTSGADSSGFLLLLVHRVRPNRSVVKGGRDLWTRTPADLPQGSPWTSAGLGRTPAHFRCARALLSLLISAAAAASSFHRGGEKCDSRRRATALTRTRGGTRPPSELSELSEPPEPRRFRTHLLTMLPRSRPRGAFAVSSAWKLSTNFYSVGSDQQQVRVRVRVRVRLAARRLSGPGVLCCVSVPSNSTHRELRSAARLSDWRTSDCPVCVCVWGCPL